MIILYLIGLILVMAGAHYVGTDIFGLNDKAGFGGMFDLWMCFAILAYGLPIIIPGAVDFYRKLKNILITEHKQSKKLATVLAILLTVLFPFVVVFAILLAIIGVHMILSYVIGLLKK